MSDFPENKKLTGDQENKPDTVDSPSPDAQDQKDEYDQYQTIFGDPSAHKPVAPKKNGKKRILSIVAACLAVAVLVGGTITVIKLIPVKEDDSATSSAFESIKVLDLKSDNFSNVSVINKNGTFKFYSEKTETASTSSDSSSASSSGTSTETKWYVDGIDKNKVDSSSITTIISAAASVTASRKIESKTASECGFDAPVYRVDVTSADGDYSVLVGSDSPDGSGTYLKLTTDETIYLVDSSSVSCFNFELLDFADKTAFAGMTVESDMSSYAGDDGKLTSFDSITVSGANFPSPVVIVPNDDTELASYIAYKIISPTQRMADKVDDLFKLFTDGVSVTGAYAFDTSASSLAAVGLNSPYMTVTVKIGNHERTFKIAKVDDTNCAVITDGSLMIKKVAASSFSFLDYKTENFYGSWVCMQSINQLSNMTLTAGGETYSFDIVYDSSEDAEETYVISCNGEKITAKYFQNFYQYYVGLTSVDYDVEKMSAEPDTTITLTYSADGGQKVLTFRKSSETKYQYDIDGLPMGRITSSSYSKLLKYVKLLAEGKDIQ